MVPVSELVGGLRFADRHSPIGGERSALFALRYWLVSAGLCVCFMIRGLSRLIARVGRILNGLCLLLHLALFNLNEGIAESAGLLFYVL